jgi:hypothetical protein
MTKYLAATSLAFMLAATASQAAPLAKPTNFTPVPSPIVKVGQQCTTTCYPGPVGNQCFTTCY